MCGIIGLINVKETANFECFRDMMKHRGPEGAGSYIGKDVYLGHRRLAIVDLSANGNQPFCNEQKTVYLVANGEIYNAPMLRSWLLSLGHRFSSQSDCEVILHAYEEWGSECISRLQGIFAFIIWDERNRQILAARDPAGTKPLYYSLCGAGLIMASECLPLASFRKSTSIDRTALAYYLTLGYVPSPYAIWDKIYKLEAGQALIWSSEKGLRLFRYWAPPAHIEQEEHAELWPELFETVVEEQMQSDVPVCAFLSAGLDSSSLCLAAFRRGFTLHTQAVGFEDSSADESPFACMTSQTLGFPVSSFKLKKSDLPALFEIMAQAYDEPAGYGAFASMLFLCSHTAQNFKVALSGDGGDEVFGGYGWYSALEAAWQTPHVHKKRGLLSFLPCSPRLPKDIDVAFARFAEKSILHRHASLISPRFLPEEASWLVFGDTKSFTEEMMLAPLKKWYVPSLPIKRAAQRVDIMTFSADVCMPKTDRASMHYSLEVRPPFLDQRIIEWGLTRPMSLAFERSPKQILRSYLCGNIPEAVLNHPKQGFSLRCMDGFDFDTALTLAQRHTRVDFLVPGWEDLLSQPGMYQSGRRQSLLFLLNWCGAQQQKIASKVNECA
jgi:asparagine synthase (glutamine-hydrolysing)